MLKFNPNYILTVEAEGGGTIEITPPLTLEIDVFRATLGSTRPRATFRVYNLSELNRNRIRFNFSNYSKIRQLSLRAGYGRNMPRIFFGNVVQAWSAREGRDMVTTIECFDGGFASVNGFTDKSFPKGTPRKLILMDLASSLPGLDLGAIGDYEGTLKRGNSYSGSTMALLSELSGGGSFVDDGKMNVLKTDEYIELGGSSLIISPGTGLLETPHVEQTIVRFEMLFEPQLRPGTKIVVQSQTAQNINGEYRCNVVHHRGTLSEAVGGSLTTTGEFFYTKLLSGVLSL